MSNDKVFQQWLEDCLKPQSVVYITDEKGVALAGSGNVDYADPYGEERRCLKFVPAWTYTMS